jgi:hypothetical protein
VRRMVWRISLKKIFREARKEAKKSEVESVSRFYQEKSSQSRVGTFRSRKAKNEPNTASDEQQLKILNRMVNYLVL